MTSFESSRRLRDEPQAEISTGRTAHNARAVEWIVRGLRHRAAFTRRLIHAGDLFQR